MPNIKILSDLFSVGDDSLRTSRDLRLDFFRGLALVFIFLCHIPGNFLAWFTLQALMCADAAEAFVLASGFTAGTVYGRSMDRDGFLTAAIRVYQRVWQLYIVHILLFIALTATIAYTAQALKTPHYINFYGTTVFLNEPGLALLKMLFLQFQPHFMDILPLYIVCLGLLPLVLAGLRFQPSVVIATSLLLWLAVQLNESIALPTWPESHGWWLNPFAWQALYVLGVWFGWRSNDGGDLCTRRQWLVYLAAGLVVAGFLLRFKWTLHGFYGSITPAIPGDPLSPFLSKMNLGFIRFANIVALALLVGQLTHRNARFFATQVARPFIVCGQNSLYTFCLSILLAVFAHVMLREVLGGRLMQLAVSTGGIAIMTGFALLLEWLATARKLNRGPSVRTSATDATREINSPSNLDRMLLTR